jgi:hypothetical protein
MLAGGLFLLINSTLEIHNKLEGEDPDEELNKEKRNQLLLNLLLFK